MSPEEEKTQATSETPVAPEEVGGLPTPEAVVEEVKADVQSFIPSEVVNEWMALKKMKTGLAELEFFRLNPCPPEAHRYRCDSGRMLKFPVVGAILTLERSGKKDMYHVKLRAWTYTIYYGPTIGEEFDRLVRLDEVVDFVKSFAPRLTTYRGFTM